MIKIQNLLFIFLLQNYFSFALSDNMYFRTLAVEDGLSETTANVLFQDSRNFMWFGMNNGLCRYDGIKIKTYPEFNSQTIRTICQTNNTLWVGALSGLKHIDLTTGKVADLSLSKKGSVEVYSLLSTQSKLYICTKNGLYIYANGQTKHLLINPNIFSDENTIMDICEVDNNYWLITLGGLFLYEPKTNKFEKYSGAISVKVPTNYATMLHFDGKLFIGVENLGLQTFNLRTKTMETSLFLADKSIRKIACHDSILYVATDLGLELISPFTYKYLKTICSDENHSNGLYSNKIFSFLRTDNTLWLSTYTGGVSYTQISPSDFTIYSKSTINFSTLNKNVRSSCIDKLGNRLIGTRDGLYYINENIGQIYHFTTKNNQILRSNTILFLHPFESRILVGTLSGLYVFDPVSLSLNPFSNDKIYSEEAFYDVCSDQNNNFFFGISGGLLSYNNTHQTKKYTTENSAIFGSDIHTVVCDKKNRIWAGGINGVCLVDTQNRKIIDNLFSKERDSKLQSIRCIYEDSRGNIWICTSKDGLYKINETLTEISHYTANDLLPSDVVYTIREDKKGFLWITTLKGILMFRPFTGEKMIFDLSDGLPSYRFNLYSQIDDDGSIWWGNENGLIYCNPDKVRERKKNQTQEILITSVFVAGKELQQVKDTDKGWVVPELMNSIKIFSTDGNISFHLSQLSYTSTKGSYEYKLEGYDDKWNKSIDNNSISYGDLPVGKYRLIIRGLSGSSEKIIFLKVERPIVQYAFYMVCLLLLLAVVYLFSKRRVLKRGISEKLLSLDKRKEKYSSSKLHQDKMVEIKDRLLVYMDLEKPYINPQLKLSDLASSISCSPTYLSQCFNQELQTNFTDFINSYRIELFKEKEKNEDVSKFTLFALAQVCGFSSRTTFFRLFKKQTGYSPSEYIKENNVNIIFKEHDS